jgi:hypothetical protein
LRGERLKELLVFDEPSSILSRSADDRMVGEWAFRPVGQRRERIYFLWIKQDRKIGGSRCVDHPSDKAEPWRYRVRLPKKFLRAMLDIAPQDEVAAAIAKTIIK